MRLSSASRGCLGELTNTPIFQYRLTPPTGSVLETFTKLWWRAQTMTGWFKRPNWDYVRPSMVPVAERPSWMTYDDAWVDEARRALIACRVFLFLPVFQL